MTRPPVPHAALWRRWRESRDYAARDDLVELYQHLAPTTVRHLISTPPPQFDRDEANAEAVLGLLMAVERFNPLHGSRFESYAIPTIRGVLLDWLNEQDWSGKDRCRFVLSLDELRAGVDLVADAGPGPEEQEITRLECEALDRYMAQLAPVDQLLLNEIYRQGVHRKDAARSRGRSIWWVRKRVNLLLAQLRVLFEKGEEK